MKDQIEKQAIEEMAKVIEKTEQIARDAHCGYPSPRMIATDLYEKGWRKQSENIIELPVKVGDYVYYIKGGYYRKSSFCEVSRPCKVVEVSFKLQRSGNSVMSGFITDNGTRYSFNGIGKTVFLTKEEAEKALAERRAYERAD